MVNAKSDNGKTSTLYIIFLKKVNPKGSQTSSTTVSEKTEPTQQAFTCLKLTMEILKQGVKYIQS